MRTISWISWSDDLKVAKHAKPLFTAGEVAPWTHREKKERKYQYLAAYVVVVDCGAFMAVEGEGDHPDSPMADKISDAIEAMPGAVLVAAAAESLAYRCDGGTTIYEEAKDLAERVQVGEIPPPIAPASSRQLMWSAPRRRRPGPGKRSKS